MTITVCFVATVVVILLVGLGFRRWDTSRNLRFTDEAGSSVSTPALARVEARRLALHPTFLWTLGLVAAISGLLVSLEQSSTVEADSLEFFAFIGVPLAGLALVVAAHRNTTRAGRDGTDELFASTPTAPRARTAAMLLACLGPVPIVLGYILITRVALERMLDAPVPALWSVFAVLAASMLLAVIGGGIVGVFLGRWLPTTAAALAGIVIIIWLNNGPDNHHPRFRWLRVAVEKDLGGRFDITPSPVLRLSFLAGLVALGACLALWSHPARRGLVAATVLSVAVVLGVGRVMTRPPSTAAVARVVDQLQRPEAHQSCTVRDGVRYCVYPGVESWIDVWHPAVTGVLGAVPTEFRPAGVAVVQRETVPNLIRPTEYNGDTAYPYTDEVVEELDPESAWPADGQVHPSLQMNEELRDLDVGFQVASLAVGLPPSTSWDHPAGCRAGGQARVVLAAWLTGGATDTARAGVATHATRVRSDSLQVDDVALDTVADYEGDSVSVSGLYPVVGAAGYGSDVLAAEAMLRADRERVAPVVAAHWSELVDPSTPTARLLDLVGVESPAGPPQVTPGSPGACP